MSEQQGPAISGRIRVTGWLRTLSPLHVGGADRGRGAVVTVAEDGLGRCYVPGTGLAGALRAAAARIAGGESDALRALWGWTGPAKQDGAASRLVIRDGILAEKTSLDRYGMPDAPLERTRLETRFSVGIDRVTGTAAHGILHARAVVPRGVYLRLEMEVRTTPATAQDDARQFDVLLRALRHGQIRFGAAKSRGLGRVELVTDETVVHEEDLSSAAGLVAALGHGGTPDRRGRPVATPRMSAASDTGPSTATESTSPPLPQVTIRVDWRPVAPLMVRAAVDAANNAALPYSGADGPEAVRLVLPGASLKGRLRAHAERVERTVRRLPDVESGAAPAAPARRQGRHDAPDTGDDNDERRRHAAFRRQLDELPAIRALFGASPTRTQRGRGAGGEADPRGAAALTVDDCRSASTIPRQQWESLLGIPPGPDTPTAAGPRTTGEADAPDAADRDRPLWPTEHGLEWADHVAIDRWTGGAAEARLFSVLEPATVTWEPLTLTLDEHRLADHGPTGQAAWALLLLVLRDLAEGHIPLGWGTNRGMGDIEVRQITLAFPDRTEPVPLTDYLTGPEAAELTEHWRRYTEETPA